MKLFRIPNCFFVLALFSAGALVFAQDQLALPPAANELRSDDQRKMQNEKVGLVIHGGAGTIERSKMTPVREREYRAGQERVLAAGSEIYERGGSSVDANEADV